MITRQTILEFFNETNWTKKLRIFGNNPNTILIREVIVNMTSYLPANSIWLRRAWHIINDTKNPPACIECGAEVKWTDYSKKYSDFCSMKCSHGSNQTKERRKSTIVNSYGVEYITQSKDFREKVKNTNIEKYGVESTLSDFNTKEKIKKTNTDRYGVENPFASTDIQKKIKITNLERYGVENPNQNEEIKQKSVITNLVRYGTNHSSQNLKIKNKLKYTNKVMYDGHPMQVHISKKSKKLLKDVNWLKHQHHVNKLTITEIADMLGIYDTTLNSYFKKYNIETKHYFTSIPEKKLCALLITQNLYYEQNTRTIIHPYELDIYIPDQKLAIEYCGLYWHSEEHKPDNYHRMKYEKCKALGIRLITLFEDEWLEHENIVKGKLLHILGKSYSRKIFARKTTAADITRQDKSNFFDQYHIQGNGPSSINIGLKHDNEIVAVMGFIKNNDNSFTLNRYATSCNVVGGFSKLLKYFEKEYNSPKIISFADLRWSEGDLYYNNGFIMDKKLRPDYYWTDGRHGRHHKFNFRHSGMKTKLKNYDPALSETDNMHAHGFFKIYDCGKLRFVKN
jgi:hypothetical protein